MTIKEIRSTDDYLLAAKLFQEYAHDIGIDLEFQNFDAEINNLQQQYSRPEGAIFIAYDHNNTAVGCVGVRKLENTICELKRMYIKPEARGKGLGTLLVHKCIDLGIELGYSKMRLDTLSSMHAAIHVYTKAGFYEIESYRFNPFEEAKFYERKLVE
jgi:ribosomal protein S18 acetylase RimI-like enzyme